MPTPNSMSSILGVTPSVSPLTIPSRDTVNGVVTLDEESLSKGSSGSFFDSLKKVTEKINPEELSVEEGVNPQNMEPSLVTIDGSLSDLTVRHSAEGADAFIFSGVEQKAENELMDVSGFSTGLEPEDVEFIALGPAASSVLVEGGVSEPFVSTSSLSVMSPEVKSLSLLGEDLESTVAIVSLQSQGEEVLASLPSDETITFLANDKALTSLPSMRSIPLGTNTLEPSVEGMVSFESPSADSFTGDPVIDSEVISASVPAAFTVSSNASFLTGEAVSRLVAKGSKLEPGLKTLEGAYLSTVKDFDGAISVSKKVSQPMLMTPTLLEGGGEGGAKQGLFPDALLSLTKDKLTNPVMAQLLPTSAEGLSTASGQGATSPVLPSSIAVTPMESQFSRVAIPVNVTFGSAQWSTTMAERTAWAVSQNIQTADMQLDPPELGPIQVKIHVHQDQATVSFVSNNPAVRDALEQSVARLRDMLEEQGIELLDAGVSDHPQSQPDDSEPESDLLAGSGEAGAPDELKNTIQIDVPTGIDYFA